MNKKVIPTYHTTSLFSVDPNFFSKLGIKYVLSDLDNTLDSFKNKLPSNEAKEYKNKLEALGIKLIIASNNNGTRVKKYSNALGVEYYSSLGKPFGFVLKRILHQKNINFNECILVGDQIMTDIKCGNACGIKTMLTEPLVNEDQWQTKFNRIFDRPIRKKLKRKGLLNSWKEVQ